MNGGCLENAIIYHFPFGFLGDTETRKLYKGVKPFSTMEEIVSGDYHIVQSISGYNTLIKVRMDRLNRTEFVVW